MESIFFYRADVFYEEVRKKLLESKDLEKKSRYDVSHLRKDLIFLSKNIWGFNFEEELPMRFDDEKLGRWNSWIDSVLESITKPEYDFISVQSDTFDIPNFTIGVYIAQGFITIFKDEEYTYEFTEGEGINGDKNDPIIEAPANFFLENNPFKSSHLPYIPLTPLDLQTKLAFMASVAGANWLKEFGFAEEELYMKFDFQSKIGYYRTTPFFTEPKPLIGKRARGELCLRCGNHSF